MTPEIHIQLLLTVGAWLFVFSNGRYGAMMFAIGSTWALVRMLWT